VLVAACAQLPSRPATESLGGFELTGRVAVRHGGESANGRVQWRHSDADDDLLITNPLGQGVARIERTGSEVTLTTSDGRRASAADAASLTEEVLGWRLPLEGLPDWVRGRPREGAPAQVQRNDAGQLSSLSQDGWQIEYEDYEQGRPSRLRLSYPGVELRLAVESLQEPLP
jgi:outer membrane lipoprotein LolB